MKKISLLVLPLAAVLLMPGCMQQVNQSPELTGIGDITCLAGQRVDLLDGVAALDTEDGDITPDIDITIIPQTAVSEDYYAVFEEAGTYEIIYEVKDSLGKSFRTTAYADVIEREVMRDDIATGGFRLTCGGHADVISEGTDGSGYSFSVQNGEIAEDIRLGKQYTLTSGVEYTFTYNFTSNFAGRIKAAADGKVIADLNVVAGENAVTFEYANQSQSPSSDCNVELWFGGLEGGDGVEQPLEVRLSGSRIDYVMPDSEYVAIEDFNFTGRTQPRFDGVTGTVTDNGNSVTLEITQTDYSGDGDMWRGGAFIDTGFAIEAGTTYIVEFDSEAENALPYGVNIQRQQWGPDEVIQGVTPVSGERTVAEVTPAAGGTLWLYIQSGNSVNTITLSNLKVTVRDGGPKTEYFNILPFTLNQVNGGAGSLGYEGGSVVYTPTIFGNSWGDNELRSPSFYLSGAAENYVIQFTANAEKTINCVFAASTTGSWNTFAWRNFTIEEGKNTYSINCDSKALDGNYYFIWQFGSSANAVAAGAKIKISDIKICYKSDLE